MIIHRRHLTPEYLGLLDVTKKGQGLKFFKNDILVDCESDDYANAIVFFGKEKNLNIRVVIKQFSGVNESAFVNQIKLFSRLENELEKQNRHNIVKVLRQGTQAGLPHIMAYKQTKDCSELMMSLGGQTLEHWIPLLGDTV